MDDQRIQPSPARPENELLSAKLVRVNETTFRVQQRVICTTEDKMELILNYHLKKAERTRDWIAPVGLLLAIMAALVTSTFQDYLLSAETWNALFVIIGIISFVWLLWTLNAARKSIGPKDIIKDLKADENNENALDERSGA
jgi:hypothetical protein